MNLRRLIWGSLLGLFFASTLFLSLPFARELFVSPDENAAYVFAKTFANTGRLELAEPLNDELGGLLHPRSTVGYGETIIPASFIGFVIILGAVGALFGSVGMYFVTPLLAVVAILCWRDSVKRVFQDRLLADAAAFLLMIHPAFWYYTGRVMMHNVAFLALLIIGLWWCLALPLSARASKTHRSSLRLLDFGVGGSLFGAALLMRTSEIIWLSLALLAVFVVYRAVIGWRASAAFGIGFAIMLGLLGVMNAASYGSPFVNGYTVQYPYAAIVISDSDASAAIDEPKRNFLLPFGFHERVILDNVLDYGWKLYPWMSILAAAGILISVSQLGERRKLWRTLAIFTLALAAWLGIVYGSWKIIDNPDPSIISLGNSHVRYWLPLFTLASVFGARALIYMLGDRSRLRVVFVSGLVLLSFLLSLRLVFFGHDGFVPNREALATFEAKQARLFEITEDESIIIVDRADKYLFPERRVVVPLRSESTHAGIPGMLEQVPVYYFGITLPAKDIDHLNNVQLSSLGVRIELVETMNEESLYRFVTK
jgi:hypothetical protein